MATVKEVLEMLKGMKDEDIVEVNHTINVKQVNVVQKEVKKDEAAEPADKTEGKV